MGYTLAIPCHWDMGVLDEITHLNNNSANTVGEFYGTISLFGVTHGRAIGTVSPVDKDQAIEFKNESKSRGIDFSFLLNSPYNGKWTNDLENYISWIVQDFEADALVISSHDLMKQVRNVFPDVPINISTITRVNSRRSLEKHLDIGPAKVVAQHDVNRNFDMLRELESVTSEQGITFEIMLTESCLRRCPRMKNHYATISTGDSDVGFHRYCNTKKVLRPEELLNANFIRPEDIPFYESFGIENFKITGRSKPASWLPEVVKAYLDGKYEGNLVRLLGIDPNLHAEEWIHLDNAALTGFISGYPREPESELTYCREWASKLISSGQLTIKDGEYSPTNEGITCTTLSPILDEVYSK